MDPAFFPETSFVIILVAKIRNSGTQRLEPALHAQSVRHHTEKALFVGRMLQMMQKMLPQQAAVPRPRYLSCLPHYSSSDRDAHARPLANEHKWKSSLVLGTAAAALTFATLTRVTGFLSRYSDGSTSAESYLFYAATSRMHLI